MLIRFVLQRFLRMLTVVVGVTLIAFLLMHAIPGNPWSNYSATPRMLAGLGPDPVLQRELDRRFGLNLPLWRQFTRYVVGDFDQEGRFFCGVACGNLGPSLQQRGRSVQDILFGPPEGLTFWESRFGYSIRLVLLGSLFTAGIGIPLGFLSAVKPRSALSSAISVGLAASVSIPNFVIGLLAVIVLASWLKVMKVLPDWNNASSWVIPAIVLAILPLASTARVTRAAVMNILNEEYIRAARARGLTQTRVMLVHVMRNALVTIVTFLGPVLIEMFAGLLIIENLFSFPGFGQEYWRAVLALDYPMMLGVTMLYATGIVLVNAAAEVLCEVLDPRLRSNTAPGAP